MVKYNIGAVVAEFNYDITHMMLELAKAEAKVRDCEITKIVMVPGVFDMPLAIKKLTEADEEGRIDLDCIITLGTVIEGATDHDQIVAQHPGMTRLDAHRRVSYGKNAVEAAVKMCDRLQDI